MIKNCFITDNAMFEYDIKHGEEVIAKAHTLSIRDKRRIFQYSQDGNLNDTDQILLIKCALDSWELADKDGKVLDLTEQNIANVKPEFYTSLVMGIMQHEIDVAEESRGIEKN